MQSFVYIHYSGVYFYYVCLGQRLPVLGDPLWHRNGRAHCNRSDTKAEIKTFSEIRQVQES